MIVFLIAVALLVTHAQTGLTVSCIGVIVACLTLLVTVFTNGGAAVKEVLRGVDYKTLLFFIGLFISVAGLEQTGVLKLIAQFISNISGGSIKVVILIILLLSAVCSALIDNIPFAATMVPVVQSIAATQGMDLSVLAWALSLGTDLGGNATPIGASANVVRVGQEWSPHQLGQILQILRPGHRAGHCGLAGMPVPEIPVILHQKGGNAS